MKPIELEVKLADCMETLENTILEFKKMAEMLRNAGLDNTAEYLEKFGTNNIISISEIVIDDVSASIGEYLG